MPRKGFASEQIIRLMKEEEILIGEDSTYKWQREYSGLRADRAKRLSPAKRRRTVFHVCTFLEISQRRACGVLAEFRSTQRPSGQPREGKPLLVKLMVELACQYGRYGYRRTTALLRSEGWKVNHKRVERLCRREARGRKATSIR